MTKVLAYCGLELISAVKKYIVQGPLLLPSVRPYFINVQNKLECFTPSRQVLCLWVRPGIYPRAEHHKCASLGLTLALLENIRLGWKGLAGTNTLAYYEH